MQRFLPWIYPALLLAGAIFLGNEFNERRELDEARRLLLEGEHEEATALYAQLQDSLFNWEEASAGTAISSSLLGEPPLPTSDFNANALALFPARLLLFNSLRQGNFSGCLQLARLLHTSNALEDAQLFERAALLELGESAPEVTEGIPETLRETWLAQRLADVGQELEQGSEAIVYDRRGELLGTVAPGGELSLMESVDPALLPGPLYKQASFEEFTKGVRLSIDLEMSKVAQKALKGYRGSIVVVDPHTGEIVVAVSDPKSQKSGTSPALQQLIEPASISKLITSTAALRAGLDVDKKVAHMTCRGAERYSGGILYCAYRAGRLGGLSRAMAVSCNIAFANLGVQIGRSSLLAELRRFGFDRPSASGIRFGRIVAPRGNQRQLADLSIGLEATTISPVHAALLAATFGNNGKMPEPGGFHSEDGILGLTPVPLSSPEGQEIIEEEWLGLLLESMEAAAAPGGTASGLIPAGYRYGMKTGTAAGPGMGYFTNYIGVGPLPNPRYAFCIRVTNQQTSKRVARATRHVARRFLPTLVQGS